MAHRPFFTSYITCKITLYIISAWDKFNDNFPISLNSLLYIIDYLDSYIIFTDHGSLLTNLSHALLSPADSILLSLITPLSHHFWSYPHLNWRFGWAWGRWFISIHFSHLFLLCIRLYFPCNYEFIYLVSKLKSPTINRCPGAVRMDSK